MGVIEKFTVSPGSRAGAIENEPVRETMSGAEIVVKSRCMQSGRTPSRNAIRSASRVPA
jgi:hypothetical protein